ncbi:MAG TPA: glycoside hydrolase family 130 protein [Tepidisphaeraceae bacterium]|jgi:predicted GH43/DUF377 family glycosyl hydrolase|nr:glycoside hydrolase family 130 protein [Tepidisphaeraceae bacterium]
MTDLPYFPDYHDADLVRRFEGNPILTGRSFPKSAGIAHVFNSGACKVGNKYVMVCRTETLDLRPAFWIAESDDGVRFTPRAEPIRMPIDDPMFRRYADINYYDPRITWLEGAWYVMHACHSRLGDCRISLLRTTSFDNDDFEWLGFVSDPGQRNGVLFPEKIGGHYVRLDRPQTSWEGGNMWVSRSPDLIHWGQSRAALATDDLSWAWTKVGGGAPPIRTDRGWLNIFHGVRTQVKAHLVYEVGVCLHDLERPEVVTHLCRQPILTPMKLYEHVGQSPSVVFVCGAIVEPDGSVKLYYGGADAVQCVAFTTLAELLDACEPFESTTAVPR